ncbi:MAG: class I SAM-dependent methyltransferase [Cyanobacteria bacterium J06626_6]
MEIYSSEWAENYERLAEAGIPGREGLHRICQAAFCSLPTKASILIVGCGTGVELVQLAKALPEASFVAFDVEIKVREEMTLTNVFRTAGLTSTIKPFSSLLYGAWLSIKN